jgi:hypothetical protein
MVHMEEELERAVVVTVAGFRGPELMPDLVAGLIHEKVALTRFDFSIQDAEPANFLILCRSGEVHDSIINRRWVVGPRFTLLFSPWSHRNNSQQKDLLTLAELEIRGIPSHA